jgi:hypothetical protein
MELPNAELNVFDRNERINDNDSKQRERCCYTERNTLQESFYETTKIKSKNNNIDSNVELMVNEHQRSMFL